MTQFHQGLNQDPNQAPNKGLKPIVWADNCLTLLDQRRLPSLETYQKLHTAQEVASAITEMVVRGAPAIGITAAYGVVLSYLHRNGDLNLIQQDMTLLAKSRPTAVNLHYALARMERCLSACQNHESVSEELRMQAQAIHQEDLEFSEAISAVGAEYIAKSGVSKQSTCNVLTHCNTGALATGGPGTALGIIKKGAHEGLIDAIYATETRPWLQGSRLTAFELAYEKLNVTLLVEGAAASLMASNKVQWLIVGADRITANGDVANKIGTHTLAVIAKQFGVKVMVAAPMTTVDFSLSTGQEIPIEYRTGQEILAAAGYQEPDAVAVFNPAFDVTPATLIDVIVTERGAVRPSELRSLAAHPA